MTPARRYQRSLPLHPCGRYGLATLILFVCAPLHAQSLDPPVVGRPPDFSEIVGAYQISSHSDVEEVRVEQPVLLTVVIEGSGPEKYHPRQEKLKIFPKDAQESFYIEPLPEKAQAFPEKGLWQFVYRLRPKSEDVEFIPGLKLTMYHPARRKFQPSYADPIPLTVKPAQEKEITLDLKVVQAPESFFAIRPLAPRFPWRSWLFAALILGTPLLCLLGYLRWRRLHADADSQRRKRRTLAARTALARLGASMEAAQVEHVAAGYLRDRLDFPPLEPTTSEVRRFLLRRGFSKDLARRWADFFATCAAERFSPTGPTLNGQLNRDAMALIQALEDHPCLSA